MSTAHHHAKWLSLVEVSGPFLSMPVLLRVFPQGLDAVDYPIKKRLRAAFQEWESRKAELLESWIDFILEEILDLPKQVLNAESAEFAKYFPEYAELLQPDFIVVNPTGGVYDAGKPRLLINFYPPNQNLERALPKSQWKASPATRMMELLRAKQVPLGLVTNGEHWMLVHSKTGEASSYISWYASLWLEEPIILRAFKSLLGVHRFFAVPESDTLAALFVESVEHQQEITDQLGFQVRRAVEILIRSLDQADKDWQRTLLQGIDTKTLYESALTIMMRLVFLLFAEERRLLLFSNKIYEQYYAVSTLQAQLREVADEYGEEILERRFDAWSRLLAIFRLIYAGVEHDDLRSLAYGGSLFDPDRFQFLEGRSNANVASKPLPIHNRTVLHLLEALQILEIQIPGGGKEARRLSFRALDVEQIGQVYEGLLDHTAKRAVEVRLGLAGSKQANVALSELEDEQQKGSLIAFLKKTTGRTQNALKKLLDNTDTINQDRLRIVCDNDAALFERVFPFAALLANDSNAYPIVITAGSIFVTEGSDRRSTGTHYTPFSLTESLVQHALEPLVSETEDLLSLKICDPACGSGAFLVQTCRYLADKLVDNPPANFPSDIEECRLYARRLVADKCLYGVDLNPMAVEMAKLSLWLITMQTNKPFSFLNHNLRSGDSLLGISSSEQIKWFKADRSHKNDLFGGIYSDLLLSAQQKRQELTTIPDNEINQIESKARLLAESEDLTKQIQLVANTLIGAMLVTAGKRGKALDKYLEALTLADENYLKQHSKECLTYKQTLRKPFHWPIEFPEIFAQGGFDAIVGNPPFMGGQKITGSFGTPYRNYLVQYLAGGKRGSADLCAYFFLRDAYLLRKDGMMALLATNTIAQGDTREVGLDQLVGQDFNIVRAVPSRKWPGTANLEVAHVWLRRGSWDKEFILDDLPVEGITPFLAKPGAVVGNPHRLAANSQKSFIGSYVLGMGFVLTPEEAQALIDKNPDNKDALYPYLNGEDLNSRFDQTPSRWVINFHDWPLCREAEGSWETAKDKERKEWLKSGNVPADYPEKVAADYPDLLGIVEEKVKPERAKLNTNNSTQSRRKKFWWLYGGAAPTLYSTIAGMDRVLLKAQISKTWAWVFVPNSIVFDQKLVCTAFNTLSDFALLQNSLHWAWSILYGTTLKLDMSYTPTNNFETFPFPKSTETLENIGNRYYTHRQSIMQTHQQGLTKTYNRFHNPDENDADIQQLRNLHIEMDNAVAAAYGWDDLELNHGFYETKQGVRFTIDTEVRQEVLDRLLLLNFDRYKLEVKQGLHDKKKGKVKRVSKGKIGGQMDII